MSFKARRTRASEDTSVKASSKTVDLDRGRGGSIQEQGHASGLGSDRGIPFYGDDRFGHR